MHVFMSTINNKEKLGIRDLHNSMRARLYNTNMIDLDGIIYGYDRKPKALLEFKHGRIKTINISDNQFICLSNLAVIANLPFFCIVYYNYLENNELMNAWDDFERLKHVQYYVVPINDKAKYFLPEPRMMSEKNYVRLLDALKGVGYPESTKQTYYNCVRPASIPNIIGIT